MDGFVKYAADLRNLYGAGFSLSRRERMGAMIGRFEDFIAWQKARNLTAEIYEATDRGGKMGKMGGKLENGDVIRF